MTFDDMMVSFCGFADDWSLRLTPVIDDCHRFVIANFVALLDAFKRAVHASVQCRTGSSNSCFGAHAETRTGGHTIPFFLFLFHKQSPPPPASLALPAWAFLLLLCTPWRVPNVQHSTLMAMDFQYVI